MTIGMALPTLILSSVQTKAMFRNRRNIWLTLNEWTAIQQEVKSEDWWSYPLSAREIEEWKNDIEEGYGEEKCFERVGVSDYLLNKITTPYLYNRLLQEHYRDGDTCVRNMFINDDRDDEWNESSLNNFISWATASIDGIDMNTTKEQWIKYNKAFKTVLDNSGRDLFMARDMENLFRSVTVQEVAHAA